jgi:hypothetical protein
MATVLDTTVRPLTLPFLRPAFLRLPPCLLGWDAGFEEELFGFFKGRVEVFEVVFGHGRIGNVVAHLPHDCNEVGQSVEEAVFEVHLVVRL